MANTLINNKVLGEVIGASLPNKLKFAPLAKVDTTLQGQAGDTITVEKYGYIGEAVKVAEGGQIPTSDLTMTSQDVKVVKAGNGFTLTDEEVGRRGQEVVNEGKSQLEKSILDGIDSDCYTALKTASLTKTCVAKLTYDDIVDGVGLFGEEDDEAKVLFISPEQKTAMLKDPMFIRASEMGDKVVMTGVIGEIAGCQIVVSGKVKKVTNKFTNVIVKAGALGIKLKKATNIEEDRDAGHAKSTWYGTHHYVAYLADATKCVKIVTTEA
ncbi:N4-gp56 family major capsid protein [Clostridium sp. UBA4395]|uniref:N4-gp56 family major capsid protein n=1 Tax=Clostridium sp. UBA4395 TaxID=1946360 RepID=UPI0032179735